MQKNWIMFVNNLNLNEIIAFSAFFLYKFKHKKKYLKKIIINFIYFLILSEYNEKLFILLHQMALYIKF